MQTSLQKIAEYSYTVGFQTYPLAQERYVMVAQETAEQSTIPP